jgi:hypothetical protein
VVRLPLSSRAPRRIPVARTSSGSSVSAVSAVATRRLRALPYAAAGSVLVVGAVVVLSVAFVKVGGRVPVLVVARPVQVGQAIGTDDLKVVDIAPGTLDAVVSADDESQVEGRPAALPLVAGQVLTRALVGAGAFPPPGFAVATADLKAGSFPPHLVAGSHVEVVAPASAAGAPAQVVAGSATVTEVSAPSDQGDVVVSVMADADSAKAIGSAQTGTLSLVLLPVGG